MDTSAAGWRWVIFLAALPCILSIPVLHYCDESARWLLMKGKRQLVKTLQSFRTVEFEQQKLSCATIFSGKADDALEVIQRMAKENGKPPVEGTLLPVANNSNTWVDIFKPPYTR